MMITLDLKLMLYIIYLFYPKIVNYIVSKIYTKTLTVANRQSDKPPNVSNKFPYLPPFAAISIGMGKRG